MPAHLIEQLAATPKKLAHLVAEASEEQLNDAISGGWPARIVLAHFRDDEFLCMRLSLERMLAEVDPLLHFVDGADWEPGRNRARDRKDVLLGDFALQRQASLSILNGLRTEEWARTGRTGVGRVLTIEELVQRWVRHDAEHVGQLETAIGETYEAIFERRRRRE
jgi:hypothetical protein